VLVEGAEVRHYPLTESLLHAKLDFIAPAGRHGLAVAEEPIQTTPAESSRFSLYHDQAALVAVFRSGGRPQQANERSISSVDRRLQAHGRRSGRAACFH
jgi:hypothetical protein